jgi:glycosyltransferase involved in cell wall biosynthesis
LKEIKETNQINEIQMDIIIPIYNAYEDLVKCLFSVLKFNSGYRIILINDKSSDLRIGEFFLDLFDLAPIIWFY